MSFRLTAPVLVALLLVACGEKLPEDEAKAAGPRLVVATKLSVGGTGRSLRYSGEVRARYEIPMAFRVGGKIVARSVDVGASVTRGQVLARLDPEDFQLVAAQAASNAALADADLRRAEELREKNFVSQAALDARKSAAASARAQAELASNQAHYATLAADAPGIVTAVLAEPGQVVSAGQAVIKLARHGDREIAISLPETALAYVKTGSPAQVFLWANQQKPLAGVVREISPAADPATRTFAARVALAEVDANMPVGMSATVELAGPADQAIIVPLAAIFQQGDQPAVWVIGPDAKLILRPVEVARYTDNGAVVSRGLAAGEQIVAAGAFKLHAGETVKVAP